MKRKKIIAMLIAALMCAAALTACGSGTSSTEATPSASAEDTGSDNSNAAGNPTEDSGSEGSDYSYITDKGELTIGITIYEPMNYYDENGGLTGFDTEFALAVCETLGLEPVFQEINWETKEVELSAKTIDCIWNGMTITPERSANMSISLPYVKNAQVIVVRADSGVTSAADLIGKTVVAEMGSAGEAQIAGDEADESLAQADYIGKTKQTDCLLEVKAGTADAAVLDWTLAKSMVGEGTDYSDLIMIEGLELASEEYGIAFRKDSDMTEKVDAVIKELANGGTLDALAEKYGLSLAPALTD